MQPPSETPFSIPLGPALLYLDDVRDIYQELAEFSRQWLADNQGDSQREQQHGNNLQGEIEIRAQNAVADTIEDLKDATRRELNHVSLISKAPKIKVDLWLGKAEIIAESDSPKVFVFAESINEFVRARRNWLIILSAIQKRDLLIPLAAVVYVTAAILLPVPYELKIYPNTFIDLVGAALAVILLFLLYRQYRHAVRLSPEWRRDSRGLSSRTRRDLAIALVSAVVVGFFGLWAGLLVHSDHSQPSAARSVAPRPESCGLTKAADGNARPVTCPGGNPNLAAIQYFDRLHLKVLSLGADISPNSVVTAICKDFASGTTDPIETSAVELAAAERHWDFSPPSSTDINGIVKHCPRR